MHYHFSRDGDTFSLGGAEQSTANFVVQLIGRSPVFCKIEDLYDIKIIRLRKFVYIESIVNYLLVKFFHLRCNNRRHVSVHGTDILPSLALFNSCVFVFFRSEYDLFSYRNYRRGFPALVKFFSFLFELPFGQLYNFFLSIEVKQNPCVLISNSGFMANRVNRILGVTSEICFPIVESHVYSTRVPRLCSDFLLSYRHSFLVMANELVKGSRIVRYLARKMSDVGFIVVDRSIDDPYISENIFYLSPSADNKSLFAHVDALLVPSQWLEAYGRVAVEASLHNLPVIASAVGGLPESCVNANSILVDNYTSCDSWLKSCTEFISSRNS